VRKDGTQFWADLVITALRDQSGELRGFTKVTRNLTERRQAELALGELAGRLVQIQDDERRRISRELHDTTSPLLTGLTSKLYSARQRLKASPEMAAIVEEALTMAEATATMVRTLSSMLHPPLLDQSGLLPTLRWYLDTLSSRTGLRLDVKLPDTMVRLPREREIALFRTTQEWLGNTVAVGAKAARVRLVVRPEEIDLVIEAQDGGWSREVLEQVRTNRGDLGVSVASMRERMHQLGGSLDVRAKEAGLILQARLPVKGQGDSLDPRR
jgi:signal transduction histidine kinase